MLMDMSMDMLMYILAFSSLFKYFKVIFDIFKDWTIRLHTDVIINDIATLTEN